MYALVAQEWSPTTWVLMFICMVVAILSVFVTFVVVLARASNAAPPPRRPNLVGHDGEGDTSPTVHHPHAA